MYNDVPKIKTQSNTCDKIILHCFQNVPFPISSNLDTCNNFINSTESQMCLLFYYYYNLYFCLLKGENFKIFCFLQ